MTEHNNHCRIFAGLGWFLASEIRRPFRWNRNGSSFLWSIDDVVGPAPIAVCRVRELTRHRRGHAGTLLRQTPEEPIFHELVDFPTSRRYDDVGLVGSAMQLHAKVTQIGIGKLSNTDRL